MPDILISGPAGANKTAEARRLINASAGPAVALDFQALYSALLLLERQASDGRYPPREPQHQFAYPLVEYIRRAAITTAREREIEVVLTNSDSDPLRRAELVSLLKAGATERVIASPLYHQGLAMSTLCAYTTKVLLLGVQNDYCDEGVCL